LFEKKAKPAAELTGAGFDIFRPDTPRLAVAVAGSGY
jgi:hypothetical protein